MTGPGPSAAAAPSAAAQAELSAIKTWRYLRLALVLLTLGLFASVGYEFLRNPKGCLQTSISAYYYTPVQGFFVGALVAIGIALIALKGNSDGEDILLNLAGTCAPLVAFVPTPNPGSCSTIPLDVNQRGTNIANNVSALLIMGGLALAIMAALTVIRKQPRPNRWSLAGYGIAVALFAGTVAVFFLDRPWFKDHGHNYAAIAMFAFILLDVVFNAVSRQRTAGSDAPGERWVLYWYWTITALMVVVGALIAYAGLVGDWPYWVLVIEISLLSLFMVFWIVQSIELWDRGLRPADLASPAPAKGMLPM